MKTLQKYQIILILIILISLLIGDEKPAVAGGLIDIFWSIVYQIGDFLGKTSIGGITETIGDSFLRLFGADLTSYVRPDYRGSLTGTMSEPITWSASIPGKDQPFVCKVSEPRMIRDSTSLRWDFDELTKKYLATCQQQATEVMIKASKTFQL